MKDIAFLPLHRRHEGGFLFLVFFWVLVAFVPSSLDATGVVNRNPIEAGICFEQEPVERGLRFDRKGAKPSIAQGQTSWEMHATPQGAQWMRFVSLDFTDVRFTNGKMPVVDVEIEYLLDAWGSLTVYMDTARGSTKVAEGWGGEAKWKTLKFRLEDAYFGQRDHGDTTETMTSNGADIRIYAANKAPLIRSIKITGYDRKKVEDWSPLLKVGNALNPERETLVYFAEPGQRIRYPLNNLALVDKEVAYRFTVSDYTGKVLGTSIGSRIVKADSKTEMEVEFDLGGVALGPFRTSFFVTDPHSKKVIQSVGSLIGVINKRKMEKARPTEFLYGIQKVKEPYEGIDREWLELMGVDMIRGWASGPILGDTLRTYAPMLKQQGITAIIIIDPPKPGTFTQYNPKGFPEGERTRLVAEMVAQLTPLAKELKGVVTYWEIGNEPDLKAFYSGPVEEYIQSFREIRAAIKKGNPDAIVMNGGLCYFGEDGKRRAKIIVDALAPDEVDAWAYHAHGPYASSERRILEMIRGQAAVDGHADRPFFDTESGVAAKSDTQLFMQAQTVIQKMVYAQSQGVPAFAWFALHMGESEWEYTSAVNLREPRPVILSYRTLVQQLRHRRYTRTIPLTDPTKEAYLFTSKDDAEGVVVLWSNDSMQKMGLFQLAPEVTRVIVVDMFGNERAISPFGDGIFEVPLSKSPVFIRWNNPSDYTFAEVVSPLELPNPVRLASASKNEIPVRLRNVTDSEKTFEVVAEAQSTTPLDIAAIEPVTLAGGASRELLVRVLVGDKDSRVIWPVAWKVFARQSNQLEPFDLGGIRSLVNKIDGIAGTWHFLENQSLNIAAIAGGSHERDTAIVLGLIQAPQAMTVEIGASADWWMQVFLNGKEIISTLEHGNQGPGELAAHTAKVSLHRGNNLIAAKILSGSGGWRFMTGGPDDLLMEKSSGKPINRFDAFLRVDGKRIAEQSSRIQFARPVFAVGRETGSSYADLPPEAEITADQIENFHEKHPDPSRWYGGKDDLGGMVWLYRDDTCLRLTVRIQDDVLVGAQKATQLADQDAITVTLRSADSDTPDRHYTVSADGRTSSEGFGDGTLGLANTVDGVLIYQFAWPLESFDVNLLDLSIELHDSDQGYPKQKAILSLERILKSSERPL